MLMLQGTTRTIDKIEKLFEDGEYEEARSWLRVLNKLLKHELAKERYKVGLKEE